ncbi:E3 ubiquitin-protein ligase DTX3L isoform X2 [Hypomesus transpacificus]|uniref:E3 ubiquitin-protein ligase DTX3L isoform X2 n=1 Tax=Hypomesus transpacificus TaxID=137520 RepID=UPI001F082714|nr:E3 ubiquitin-protein ligase DTX3L isoform X2 [Hypomesus transpacificus]
MADTTDQETPMEVDPSNPTAPPLNLIGQHHASTASTGRPDATLDHHRTTEVDLLPASTFSTSTLENHQPSRPTHVDGRDDAAGPSDMSEAPTVLGTVYANVQWLNQLVPQKPEKYLQKALQTWFNKVFAVKTISCDSFYLTDDRLTFKMISSEKKEELLNALDALPKELDLCVEDGKEKVNCKVWFEKSPPKQPETEKHIPKQETHAAPNDRSNGMVQSGRAGSECSVPLATYWYMTSAYQNELQSIEKKHKVKIQASVKVTMEEAQATNNNLHTNEALEELIDFVQTHTGDLDSFIIHLDQVDSKDLLDALKRDPRLLLSCSSGKLSIVGPSESIRRVQNVLGNNSSIHMPASFGASGWPQKITMDIKDPLVTSGLSMPLSLWKLLKGAFDQNIKDIQDKFGVIMKCEPSDGKVLVRAEPRDGQTVPLESHALRALMHIYQRVATSTMSCSLLASDRKAAVEDMLGEILSLHPHVWPEKNSGSLRLFGLPQHLGPAVTQLERKMGGPVFKEEDKQKILYSGDASSSATTASDRAGGGATGNDDEECCICRETFKDKKTLPCNHGFCSECLQQLVASLGPTCPLCKYVFGVMEGDQPKGVMNDRTTNDRLPGFNDCGTIIIDYNISGGTQSERHPHPGKPFHGTSRTAYLPDNKEGQEVSRLLRKAFDQKLIFTIGTSRTSGVEDAVTWNDIHHKTNIHGGPQSFGYPDDGYLARVKEELKSKGIE